jgi:hypothetical protein
MALKSIAKNNFNSYVMINIFIFWFILNLLKKIFSVFEALSFCPYITLSIIYDGAV